MRLIAENLSCERGGRIVFSDLSFAIEAGEALQVTGRNGAGKSSLLRLVAGMVRMSSGSLTLERGEQDKPIAEQVHYCGHLDACKPSLTAQENLDFWRDFLGGGGLSAYAALEAFGIARLADTPAGYLSAGQKRRLSLARLLAVKRPLWLLDEPTAALDTASQHSLFDAIKAHCASGGLALIATHMPLDVPTRELRIGT
jgi:heme exporter protein A